MSESSSPSMGRRIFGVVLVAIAIAVFAVRLIHAGPYAVPTGGNLIGALGSLAIGVVLLAPASPRALVWVAGLASPVFLFMAVYAIGAELEETVSLFAFEADGTPAELRLWIVDRDDGEWVGMPRAKAVDHSLDGARLDLLRKGEIRCVTPVLFDDPPTAKAIHALKVDKYAVARASAVIGLYPREARESTVALRLDPCPAE